MQNPMQNPMQEQMQQQRQVPMQGQQGPFRQQNVQYYK
jgi:hypothetical protein